MTALPITPPATARGGTGPRGSSPPSGNAAPPTHFAALLSQTSARTASAEGPKNRPAQPEPRRRDAAAPKDDKNVIPSEARRRDASSAAAEDDKNVIVADAQAAAGAEQAPSQPVADGKAVGATQAPDEQSPTSPVVPTTDAAAAAVAAAAATAVPTAATATTTAAATPATGTVAPPSAAAQAAVGALAAQPGSANGVPTADGSAAPTDGTSAGKLQIPAELLNAKGGHTKDFKNGDQPKGDLPPASTLPPTTDAATAPPTAAASTPAVADPGAQAAPTPTVTTQAQPAATPLTAVPVASGGVGGTVLTRASVLQTAERVQELVRIATTRAGNARAVLQLRPAELGQVDVHLRTTRNGLVATIAAHDQAGLDALQQAGTELRRTLEDKGVQLHSLDLQLGAGQNGFSNQGDAREASSGRRGASATHDLGTDDDVVAEDDLTITHAPSTPAGALVDVQA